MEPCYSLTREFGVYASLAKLIA